MEATFRNNCVIYTLTLAVYQYNYEGIVNLFKQYMITYL